MIRRHHAPTVEQSPGHVFAEELDEARGDAAFQVHGGGVFQTAA